MDSMSLPFHRREGVPEFPGLAAESIDGPGVRIRRYRDDDTGDVRAGCDDPLTQRFLPLLPSPYTEADAAWWINEGSRGAFERGGGNFAIADPENDRLLGGIGIMHEQNGNGEIGYWVAPWGRRRGIAVAATRTLTDYAFASGYQRLQLRTEHENTSSQRVAIAAGYAREGVQRAAGASRDGSRHDLIVWARLPGDPPGPSARLLPDLSGGWLTDGVVRLEPLAGSDADDVFALYSRPEVWGVSAAPAPPRRADIERMCSRAGADWLAGSAARLAIRALGGPHDGAFAGDVSLYYASPATGAGIMGYAIGPDWRGRGYATGAVRLLATWALREAGLARITAGTAPDNAASQRVLEKAGFTREGYERGRLHAPGGGRTDVVSFALLATDLTAPG